MSSKVETVGLEGLLVIPTMGSAVNSGSFNP